MDPFQALGDVLLGIVLGAVGQLIRMIVGLKKEMDQATKNGANWTTWFNTKQLVVSILISVVVGGIAGALGIIGAIGTQLTQQTFITLIVTGYAGTDFIEGFMSKAP